MYDPHPAFNEPEDENIKIWRYMDFPKFCSILCKKALYFSDIFSFEDNFEGSYPKNPDQVIRRPLTYDEIAKFHPYPKEYYKLYSDSYELSKEIRRKLHKVCCFHMNEHESLAIWKLYSYNYGLAIQTTYKKLKQSFDECKYDVHFGKINYIDYGEEGKDTIDPNNEFYLYLHKRKSFEHEKELRAIIWAISDIIKQLKEREDRISYGYDELKEFIPEWGIYAPVDINLLIERIYLSPKSPSWYKDVVEDITRKYGYNFEIINSSLDDTPVY